MSEFILDDSPVVLTYLGMSANDTTATTTINLAGQTLDPSATFNVALVIYGNNVTLNSASIDGVSATIAKQIVNGTSLAVVYAPVTANSTGTVSFTFSGVPGNTQAATFSLKVSSGNDAANSKTSTSNPVSQTVDIAAGGVVLCAAIYTKSGGGITFSWSGATELTDQAWVSTATWSIAMESFPLGASSQIITATPSAAPTSSTGVFVVFNL